MKKDGGRKGDEKPDVRTFFFIRIQSSEPVAPTGNLKFWNKGYQWCRQGLFFPADTFKCRLVAIKADWEVPEPSTGSFILSLCFLPAHFSTSIAFTEPQPAFFPVLVVLPGA